MSKLSTQLLKQKAMAKPEKESIDKKTPLGRGANSQSKIKIAKGKPKH